MNIEFIEITLDESQGVERLETVTIHYNNGPQQHCNKLIDNTEFFEDDDIIEYVAKYYNVSPDQVTIV